MRQKRLFSTIFLLFTIFLVILPFLVTFNEFLTRIVEKFTLYTYLQSQIVPIQVRLVTLILSPTNIHIIPYYEGFSVNGIQLRMTWNCIGWQSLLLLFITLLVGLRGGNYTLMSQIETISIGLLGTFLMNLFRLSLIVAVLAVSRPFFAILYHDYLAALFTVIWLFFFWWFAYKLVLEEKESTLYPKLS